MKKKLLSQALILLSLISMLILPHQMVYADITKLFPELYLDLESMTEEETAYVDVYFHITLDTQDVQERTKDAASYEERFEIINAMYDEIISEFLQKYYENDMDKVMKIDYDWLAVAVQATKGDILQFTEEETVMYIESAQGINGYEGRHSVGLLEVKAAAIADVTGYADLSAYRPAQQNEIQMIINQTLEDINGANYERDISVIVLDAEKRMDAVKTDEQLKKEENPKITPTDGPKPTISPSEPSTKPTITPSQVIPAPTVEPSEYIQKPTAAPSQTETRPIVVPPKSESKSEQKPEPKSESKTELKPESKPESKTDIDLNVATQENESASTPTATPESTSGKKVPLSNGGAEAEQTESEESGYHTSLAAIALIALTAIILTTIWFITKKRRHP